MAKEKQQMEAFEWFNLTPPERFGRKLPFNQDELAEHLGVKITTIKRWKTIHNELKKYNQVTVEADYNSDAYLMSRTPEADKALLAAIQRGKPEAIRLFYQLLGRLIEKREQKVSVELTADEIARRNLEVQRRTRELESRIRNGNRVAELPEQSSILPEQIRENQGQTEGDHSLGTLGTFG